MSSSLKADKSSSQAADTELSEEEMVEGTNAVANSLLLLERSKWPIISGSPKLTPFVTRGDEAADEEQFEIKSTPLGFADFLSNKAKLALFNIGFEFEDSNDEVTLFE